MAKLGISIPDEVVRRIENPLKYGDSRSQRIRELIELALEAEGMMKRHEKWPDDPDDRQQWVREAIKEKIDREREADNDRDPATAD